MAQKLQFIITVLHEPKVLILDEPLSGLDPVNSLLIKNEILELKENNTSIILSTHDMNSVEEICDEVAIINHSKKILQGSVNEIKKNYEENLWSISYRGNQMNFTNAVWGGWELINHITLNENINNNVIVISGKCLGNLLEKKFDKVIDIKNTRLIIKKIIQQILGDKDIKSYDMLS